MFHFSLAKHRTTRKIKNAEGLVDESLTLVDFVLIVLEKKKTIVGRGDFAVVLHLLADNVTITDAVSLYIYI